jgi:hypothetical protein
VRNSRYLEWVQSNEYFDTLAVYSNGPLHPGRGRANYLLAELLDWDHKKVLDIGGGTGWSHRFFAGLGSIYTTIEPNHWMREAAIREGVPEREIVACSAEEITADWLESQGPFDRLLVQGSVGFLRDGLNSIQRVINFGEFREIVFVDWFGPPIASARAPVRHFYDPSNFVSFLEQNGFKDIYLQTFRYRGVPLQKSTAELTGYIKSFFPESEELGMIHEAASKYERDLYHGDMTLKDYLITIGKKPQAVIPDSN